MDDTAEFETENARRAQAMSADEQVRKLQHSLLTEIDKYNYTYMSTWLGLPIIQSPADIVAQQECIWRAKPTVIIETGIARGGSLVFLASMLKLVDGRKVVGVDIDFRAHNRARLDQHPLRSMIDIVEGSSVEEDTIARVKAHLTPQDRVMVILDSHHSHDHVLKELKRYAPLVTPDQYLIVADTVVSLLPEQTHRPRAWGRDNSPMTALEAFTRENRDFAVDEELDRKLILSCNPRGYLRRTTAPRA